MSLLSKLNIMAGLIIVSATVAAETQAAGATVYCPPASALHCDYDKCWLDDAYKSIWAIHNVMGHPMAQDEFSFDVVYGYDTLTCQYNSFNTQNLIYVDNVVSLRPDLSIPNKWVHTPDNFDICGDYDVGLGVCPMVT